MINCNFIPKISVIVPVYNVEAYLKRCVDSILRQLYQDFEIILVDDGSTDNSGKICDEYVNEDDRVRVIHKTNGGLSSARNAGIDVSKGAYLFFVDSDDWITQDALNYLIITMERTKADIVSASYLLAHDECIKKQRNYTEKIMSRNQAVENYLMSGMKYRVADYSVCAKLYKKSLFDKVRFPKGQLYEDGATNLEIILSIDRYVKSNKIIYYYYQGRTSIVNSCFCQKAHDDLILFGEKCIELVKNEPENIRVLAAQKLARTYLSSMIRMVVYGVDKTQNEWEKTFFLIEQGLRKNYWLLMKSPMPLNRKIPMTLLAINYKLPRFFIWKIKKFI